MPRAATRTTRSSLQQRRRAALPRIEYPPELPIVAHRGELLKTLADNQVVVVAGETGSGKSTQLPKLCLELGRGIAGTIAHTQPRRIAARAVATRIAAELGVPLGGPVGYAVRFNDRSRPETLLRVMTDGLLLAELGRDPLLRRYDTVIVDEAHERSLNIDFLIGCLWRLLPRRPDLKVILTSATIDPQRLAAHFDGAPVIEVSGRIYPVEMRYRPLSGPQHGAADGGGADGGGPLAGASGEPLDQAEGIAAAVEELAREGRGDVLVFLSGEREIRDAAELLSGRLGPHTEVLPLYARLTADEQQRVFAPTRAGRRVVLATNVAETSLTVPGIRFVVDTGLARVSRYDSRLKVQRLPIEPISQASADQRAGRCGRTSDGIAIRLYARDDFAARPRFTDPEILRTSLASVILQMESRGLGEVEQFPFLDVPDRRQVRDGVTLLHEVGAIDPQGEPGRRLTPLGRRLARLPIDPRLGRMILEADRHACVREAIVIAAALSLQDPRERPAQDRARADELHARFTDPSSDFMTLLNLWRHLRELDETLSRSAFRRRLRAEFLHALRVREWEDLVEQLRQSAAELDITPNEADAEPAAIHRALLAGLLSHVGMRRAETREYVGARGARFQIAPGSALARRPPAWVMVAELAQTSRLWGRTAARIEPGWIEQPARHLLSVTHSDPRWDSARGAAVVTERATLYGLPVAVRTVPYARIAPLHARELFLRHALLEGDWPDGQPREFVVENERRIAEVHALEDRARRRDLLVGQDALHAFFDARVPAEVTSVRSFNAWWRELSDPEALVFPRSLLVREGAGFDRDGRPDRWRAGDLELELDYRFAPGEELDGVVAQVPLAALDALRAESFQWLVPGMRRELLTVLVRGLPKELRRALVPVPDLVEELLRSLAAEGSGALLPALSAEIGRLRGVRVPLEAWRPQALPDHLRMGFVIRDGGGAALAQGRDLDALRHEVARVLRARLREASRQMERSGLTDWTLGDLPRVITLAGAGGLVRGYPALVDEGAAAGVRVLESAQAQATAMRAGVRRLLLCTLPVAQRTIEQGVGASAMLSLAAWPAGAAALLEDARMAAVDGLLGGARSSGEGGPTEAGAYLVWDRAAFEGLRERVRPELAATCVEVVRAAIAAMRAADDVRHELDGLRGKAFEPAKVDVAAQLGGLVYAGFLFATGAGRVADVERYLRAARERLRRLPDGVARDADRMAAIRELEAEVRALRGAIPAGSPQPPELIEARWLIEELRVSQFAPATQARGPVSARRVRRLLAAAAGGGGSSAT